MKKIAIITLSVALGKEKGYSRFRTLAEMLSSDYMVELITSSFQHWEKRQRDKREIGNLQTEYQILLAYEPGYKKNVDIRRVFSHRMACKNILKLLETSKPDLIYCIIPDNYTARSVGRFANENHIPLIIDVEDLWPEAMEMVSPLPKTFNDLLFGSFRRDAKRAYSYADAFVGTSDEYRDFPAKKYGITGKPAITVYVGCDMDDFDSGAAEYSNDVVKKENEFWITYAGNLGSSYDIRTLIKAAQILYAKGVHDSRVKILGGGPLEEEFRRISKERPCNVDFLGYTPYRKMAAYLVKSDILVNSFVKSAPQSIVTKIGDYLAAGKPMINTLSSPEFRTKVTEDGFGCNVAAEDSKQLAHLILDMKEKPDKLAEMGVKARKICEEQFDRKNSYKNIKDMIKELI